MTYPKDIRALREEMREAARPPVDNRDILETYRDTMKRFPKTMEALRQSELREPPAK